MHSYRELEIHIIRWAEERGIVRHSTPMAQAVKTAEECVELLKALSKGNMNEARDAYADVLITLIVGAACADIDLIECLNEGYEVIKHRKGRLTADGIFVKD